MHQVSWSVWLSNMPSLISESGVNENIKVNKQGRRIESFGDTTDSSNYDCLSGDIAIDSTTFFRSQHCWKGMMITLILVN